MHPSSRPLYACPLARTPFPIPWTWTLRHQYPVALLRVILSLTILIGTLEVMCAGISTLFGRTLVEERVERQHYQLRQCGVIYARFPFVNRTNRYAELLCDCSKGPTLFLELSELFLNVIHGLILLDIVQKCQFTGMQGNIP